MDFQKNTSRFRCAAGLLGCMVAAPVLADSIDPEAFTATLAVGESITIQKTVTVSAGSPSTSRADVFFLVDTSGSMGGIINSVKSNAGSILSSTSGFGDIAWGVGSYEDFPTSPWGGSGDEAWRLNQAITTDAALVQNGINSLTLGYGNDGPESNLYALSQAASEASWRAGAQKFVVWFGDAEGHDPDTTPGYPGPTLSQTIDTLTGEMITVIGVNSGYVSGGLDQTGQATAITDATGGNYVSIGSNPGDLIVDTILDSLEAAFAVYSQVSLAAYDNLPGVDVSISAGYFGSYDRSEEREFTFDVTFTALAEGVHDFYIDALVDGGIIGTELDRIIVTNGGSTPVSEPGALSLLFAGMGLLVAARRRRQQ